MNIKNKQKLLLFFSLLIIVGNLFSNANTTITKDPDKDKILVYVIKNILTRGHFVEKDLNNDFSEKVYTSFIKGLDPNKRYFTQDDIATFSKYKYVIDDQLLQEDVSFYNLVYNTFLNKIKNAKTYYTQILEQPFNFDKKEIINIDYDNVPFAKNNTELIDYWRKQLKLSVLGRVQDALEKQKEDLKEKKEITKKTFAEIEKEARKEVLKSMNDLYYRIEELEHDDWFSTFLNSVVGAFDPHTTYMAPKIKERFDQDMSGKLEGIGARLVKKGMYTEIFELVSGGPAWKQGDLEPGDIILEVAQGSKEPTDIVGMRLDDAIKFIKGKKGTEVILTVKKKIDGSKQKIAIIRDVVELEETFVKSTVVEKEGKKFGLINLPRFYIDFSDTDSRNSGKDMEKEIERLKEENVDGLLIDLRDNGGGSLKTAIEIAGLFINEGPIVQVKFRGQEPIIRNDTDPKTQWQGAVVVLVNEFSASASEIFAAAMQDYGRAVIMGGNQTYGKGTVQSVLPINNFFKSYDKDLGALKMTIQKFYRINGGSTQIEGVYSDIAMPDRYSYMDFGERDLDGALIWDKVPQAKYKRTNSYKNFKEVVNNSKNRISNNKNFKLINEYAKWLRQNQDKNTYALNYNEFVKETEAQVTASKKYKDAFTFETNLSFKSPKYEEAIIKNDSVLASKRAAWHKNLAKDIYVAEALNVLKDLKIKDSSNPIKN